MTDTRTTTPREFVFTMVRRYPGEAAALGMTAPDEFEPTIEMPVTVRQTTRAPMRRHEPKPAGWGEVAFGAFCVVGWMALFGWMTVEAVRLAERIAAGG